MAEIVETIHPGIRLIGSTEFHAEDQDLVVFVGMIAEQSLPAKPNGLTPTGELLWRLEYEDGATDDLLVHLERTPPNRWAVNSARGLLTRRLSKRQLTRLREVLERLHREVAAGAAPLLATVRADCLARLDELDGAISVLRPVASRTEAAALKYLELLERRGGPGWEEEAISILRSLSAQSANVVVRLADLLERRGGSGWEEEAISVLHPLSAYNGTVAVRLADVLVNRGDVDEAISVLEPLSSRDQNVVVRLADVLERRGGSGWEEEAISVLHPLSAYNGTVAVRLADVLVNRGDVDEAISVLEPLSSRDQNVVVRLADVLERRGGSGWEEEAISILEPLSAESPNVAVRLVDVLERRAGLGWFDEAIAVLEPLSAQHPSVAVRLADVLERRGEAGWMREAVTVLEHATRTSYGAYRLSLLLVRSGDLDRAKDVLISQGETDPLIQGVLIGISIIEGYVPRRVRDVVGASSIQRFVTAVGRTFDASSDSTPQLWARFFRHQWPGNILPAATRYIATAIHRIAGQAYPTLDADQALTRTVSAIWRHGAGRRGAARYLSRQLVSWIDGTYPIGSPMAIERVESVLAIAETCTRLASRSYVLPPGLMDKLRLLSLSDDTLVDRLQNATDWSAVARRFLERNPALIDERSGPPQD